MAKYSLQRHERNLFPVFASWECLLMMGMQHVLSFRSVTLLMISPQIRKVLRLQVLFETLAYFCFGPLDLFDHGQGNLQSPS